MTSENAKINLIEKFLREKFTHHEIVKKIKGVPDDSMFFIIDSNGKEKKLCIGGQWLMDIPISEISQYLKEKKVDQHLIKVGEVLLSNKGIS